MEQNIWLHWGTIISLKIIKWGYKPLCPNAYWKNQVLLALLKVSRVGAKHILRIFHRIEATIMDAHLWKACFKILALDNFQLLIAVLF